MNQTSTYPLLASHQGALPLQWCFKDRMANGAYAELVLRRVKPGHEASVVDTLESGFGTHLKGSYSEVHTLLERLHDAAVPDDQALWIARAIEPVLQQMEVLASTCPDLLQLFAPKGKIELYGANTAYFSPQYISGNHTLKVHLRDVKDSVWRHGLSHLLAQHLDYPFALGERRFSTSRLFDLCFASEKVIAPQGIAAAIDVVLEGRGIYLPDRHDVAEQDHVSQLLQGKQAAIATSYQRVLQRERFATLVSWWMGGDASTRYPSPILSQYRQLVALDLAAHKQRNFLDYPPKKMDSLAESIHLPLMMIFKEKPHARRA